MSRKANAQRIYPQQGKIIQPGVAYEIGYAGYGRRPVPFAGLVLAGYGHLYFHMKRIALFIAILALACSGCWLVAYRAGFAAAKRMQLGTFIVSLGALEKLRSGDVQVATRKMQAVCFSSADMLYSDPAYHDQSAIKLFGPELIDYLAMYCTNRSEWTPVEQKLQKDLARWQATQSNLEQ